MTNEVELPVFKHSEDKLPVAIILAFSCLDFVLYFTVDNPLVLASVWLLLIYPKGKICAWNHHHQHTPTFRSVRMNRLLEFFYALHTGVTTHLWVLHHVLGHHHNYLNQHLDESRWKDENDEVIGELRYTLETAATAYYRGYLVGKTHPKVQKDFITYGLLTAAIVALLVWYRPAQGLFLFVLPMVTGLLLTAWATYGHHTGLDTDDHMKASYNNESWFYNLVTGNLGYHTAHHYKQGVHWSKLPALHEQIKTNIPRELIKSSWF